MRDLCVSGVSFLWGRRDLGFLTRGRVLAVYVIGSTLTSTIPGISIAGEMPLATLFTPALDAEYVYLGEPRSVDVIPVTPTGIPTPAIITRVSLEVSSTPYIFIDSGSYVEPRIPVIRLKSSVYGRRIDRENALPAGSSEKIFEEAYSLGERISRGLDALLIGESIPGGTTTAMAILRGLGFESSELVSSSMRNNPMDLKKKVVNEALKRLREYMSPFEINDALGDPVHIAIAGLVMGSLRNTRIILAGGTQMLAVLALIKSIEKNFDQDKILIATTRWIIKDRGREIRDFIERYFSRVSVAYTELDFGDSPHEGLRAYEEGYVKEGVGAGGTALLALCRGVSLRELIERIYSEYERVMRSI